MPLKAYQKPKTAKLFIILRDTFFRTLETSNDNKHSSFIMVVWNIQDCVFACILIAVATDWP